MIERSSARLAKGLWAGGLLACAGIMATAVAMVATVSPLALARAIMPASTPVAVHPVGDPMLQAATNGGIGRHMRLAGLTAGDGPLALSAGRITVGDRITIAGRDGAKRIYAVSLIKEIEVPITKVTETDPPARLLLVVARDVARPASRPLRFIVEADRENPAPAAATTHHQAL
ncbi:MAG: hypothetical protein KDJ36_08540 [Hyphomicrobiaceae bacterium]|nr:hypothetical protein [Hyphomicrobiaceae bacterium]